MSEREGSSPASNPGGDNTSLDPDSTDGLGPEEDSDEFVAVSYTHLTLPTTSRV